MARQTAESVLPPIKVLGIEETKAEGYYLCARRGKFGMLYDFIDEDGKQFCVKGNVDIVSKMAGVPEKCYVWIVYTGEQKTKSGQMMKQFAIEFDPTMKWNADAYPTEAPPPDDTQNM